MNTRAARIEDILLAALSPSVLILEDESHNHGAHREVRTATGAVLHDHAHHPSTSKVTSDEIVGGRQAKDRPSPETHFKILAVSELFAGVSRLDRQRQIKDRLSDEFKSGLHALTIRALTPDEYDKGLAEGFVSPSCANRARKN
jgi:stress-induced morphogen